MEGATVQNLVNRLASQLPPNFIDLENPKLLFLDCYLELSGTNVDFGIYGNVPKAKQPEFHSEMTTRQLEKFTIDHAGIQGLYADSFMTREEFWQMFDRTLYSEVRTKYEALDAFPDVYDKVSRTARSIQV